MNDVGNEHVRTGSQPLGLELQTTAFSVSSEIDALNQATFYRFRLVNRNGLPIESTYLSLWVDSDLGRSRDEWPGVDTTRALGFVYNDGHDADYGVPPAFGIDMLQGASSFLYILNAGPPEFDTPHTAQEFYNLQSGLWADGTPITESGSGYATDGPVTRWLFPGDPVTQQCWSALNDCQGGSWSQSNHRLILSSPSFSLAPGESRVIDVALVFAQGADNLDSITELRGASDFVQATYDDGALFGPLSPTASEGHAAVPTAPRLEAIYPNPVRNRATVAFSIPESPPVRLAVHDVLGRRVRALVEGPLAAGEHTARLDTARLPSGLYLIVLEAGGQRQTRKTLIVR